MTRTTPDTSDKSSKMVPLQLPHILEPLHNMRELTKQLLCLEDHLSCTERRCEDCIHKHLLYAEALADEGCALDEEGPLRRDFERVACDLHRMELAFFGVPAASRDPRKIKAAVRTSRKYLVNKYAGDWVRMYESGPAKKGT